MGYAAVRLLRLQVQIPPGAWMSVSCECCALLSKVLCNGPIARPEESTECGASECDRHTSTMKRPWPIRAVEPREKKSHYGDRMHEFR